MPQRHYLQLEACFWPAIGLDVPVDGPILTTSLQGGYVYMQCPLVICLYSQGHCYPSRSVVGLESWSSIVAIMRLQTVLE